MNKLVSKNLVEEVKKPPRIISPLTVATKQCPLTKIIKKREEIE